MAKKHRKPETKNEEQFTRRDFLKAGGAVIISAALFNSLVGCSKTDTVTETSIKTSTKTATATEIVTITPVNQEMIVTSDVELTTGLHPAGFGGTNFRGGPNCLIYEGLIAMGLDGVKGPSLAESWEMSADGKQWTFNLRKGVKFYDGSDFDSADVKFTVDWLGKYGSKKYWEGLLSVDCPNAYTATIVFDAPKFTFDSTAALIDSAIMSKNTPIDEKGLSERP
jgi:ABC-type transport system substrate-binding protein